MELDEIYLDQQEHVEKTIDSLKRDFTRLKNA